MFFVTTLYYGVCFISLFLFVMWCMSRQLRVNYNTLWSDL